MSVFRGFCRFSSAASLLSSGTPTSCCKSFVFRHTNQLLQVFCLQAHQPVAASLLSSGTPTCCCKSFVFRHTNLLLQVICLQAHQPIAASHLSSGTPTYCYKSFVFRHTNLLSDPDIRLPVDPFVSYRLAPV